MTHPELIGPEAEQIERLRRNAVGERKDEVDSIGTTGSERRGEGSHGVEPGLVAGLGGEDGANGLGVDGKWGLDG